MYRPRFRPPAEAESLILQIDEGCPNNQCTFCSMYQGIPHRRLPLDEIRTMVEEEALNNPRHRRIFLADGDPMRRPFDELQELLELLNASFPKLTRVNLYANGSSIAAKSQQELETLRALKLHTLYMGLESGHEKTLKLRHKTETASGMIRAAQRAQEAGLRMSIMVLLGLGGVELTKEHAEKTSAAVNQIQPKLLSALRVIPIKGTKLYEEVDDGSFQQLSEYQVVRELRHLIAGLQLSGTIFRANHSSNVVPLEGRFPRNKRELLARLDDLLQSGMLDQESPGEQPMWL